ncbi:hypothetical protein CK203_058418 [Vitis vinifera]|uniref:Uncharacterized protein n=2 Tax=Vitis vinifera TaxID=29760 RepID=A0A438GI60_VITVI|nr:hypothetical protein CK203_058418 [Vitis vinifera]CAN83086.1 hypothetical protein VITISV_002401 [Vitis vinifera]
MGDNVQVDALAGIAALFLVKESTMLPVYVQATPTIAESHVCNVSPNEYNWAVDIRAYLQTGTLLEDPKRASLAPTTRKHHTCDMKGGIVGSSLKIAAWFPLPCDTWHRSFHPDENAHSFHLDISHPDQANVLPYPNVSQPQFCPTDIPLSPDISQSQFYRADIPPFPDISHMAPTAG